MSYGSSVALIPGMMLPEGETRGEGDGLRETTIEIVKRDGKFGKSKDSNV